jgi:hypothetical protein
MRRLAYYARLKAQVLGSQQERRAVVRICTPELVIELKRIGWHSVELREQDEAGVGQVFRRSRSLQLSRR